MKKIAALANVSQGTVSLVLNGKAQGQISKAIQEKIIALAKEHHYRKNISALNLRKQENNVIGIIMPGSINSFYASIVTLLQKELMNLGFTGLFTFCKGIHPIDAYQYLYERNVSGIIAWGIDNKPLDTFLPVVYFLEKNSFNKNLNNGKGLNFSTFCFDFSYSTQELVEYLYNLGHKRIAFLGTQSDPRYNLLVKAFKEKGICDILRLNHIDNIDGVGESLEKIFSLNILPSVVVTTSDETAQQFIMLGLSKGFKIPQDISVVGFMNASYSQNLTPPLTTIDCHKEFLIKEMVNMIVKKVSAKDNSLEEKSISTTLVIRQSCAEAKKYT